MKKSTLLVICFAVLLTALPAFAQGGSVRWPKNPAIVLGIVVAAGALMMAIIKANRNSK